MAASRSISTGALISRERPHERHYGSTHTDGTHEHPAPVFLCSFRVVSGLMYRSRQWHTQNEQIIRPHRLCQGLDRGPEPRCPNRGASDRTLHHGPHRISTGIVLAPLFSSTHILLIESFALLEASTTYSACPVHRTSCLDNRAILRNALASTERLPPNATQIVPVRNAVLATGGRAKGADR